MNLNRVGGMSAKEPCQKRTDFMEMTFTSHKNDSTEKRTTSISVVDKTADPRGFTLQPA